MGKIFDFLIRHELLGNIVGAILFVGVPIMIVANLGKITAFVKRVLSAADEKSPTLTRYIVRPLFWAAVLLILAPIVIWVGVLAFNFIRLRSGAIQGY